jgi:hypothetical protein
MGGVSRIRCPLKVAAKGSCQILVPPLSKGLKVPNSGNFRAPGTPFRTLNYGGIRRHKRLRGLMPSHLKWEDSYT